jgi:putative ABC transport system permease protein
VVGVVEEVRQIALDAPVRSEIYLPYAQRPWRTCFLLVRSKSAPAALAVALRQEIRAIDPSLALSVLRSMNDHISASMDPPRFRTFLLSVFAVTALALATVGVFGVVSYSVAQRTRDFGLRLALGAQPHDICRLVFGGGFVIVLMGVSSGIVCSLALTRLLAGLLFGVAPRDALTLAAAATVCGTVALAACYVPLHQVMKIDPMQALRNE